MVEKSENPQLGTTEKIPQESKTNQVNELVGLATKLWNQASRCKKVLGGAWDWRMTIISNQCSQIIKTKENIFDHAFIRNDLPL